MLAKNTGFRMSISRCQGPYLEDKSVRYEYLHTSGHAKLEDLKKLVDAMAPEMVIPIYSFHPDKFKDYFPNVRLVWKTVKS